MRDAWAGAGRGLERAIEAAGAQRRRAERARWAADRGARQREAGALLPPGLSAQPRSWAEADAVARCCDFLPPLELPVGRVELVRLHALGGVQEAERLRLIGLRAVADTACLMPPLRGGRAGWGPESLEWGAAVRTCACLAVALLLRGQLSALAWLEAGSGVRQLSEAWRVVAPGAPRRPLPPAVLSLFDPQKSTTEI